MDEILPWGYSENLHFWSAYSGHVGGLSMPSVRAPAGSRLLVPEQHTGAGK